MQGHAYLNGRSRRVAGWIAGLSLVFAFALFPVVAQASDSAGAQYEDRLPCATGGCGDGNGNNGPDNNNGNGDNNGSGGQSSSGSGNDGSSAGGAAGGGSTPPSGPSGSPGSQGGSGSAATDPGAGQAGASGGTGPGSVKLGENAADVQSSSGDDGGSSPLAGILVGLGLGAVVSVIFVVLRARRQRGQSEPVHSPNAG
jgi:hypothetical protein